MFAGGWIGGAERSGTSIANLFWSTEAMSQRAAAQHLRWRRTRMTSTTNPDLDPEADPVLLRSSLDFPVVGIGASAGGLTALKQLLET
jgi:chemotaxis response regulator CheB